MTYDVYRRPVEETCLVYFLGLKIQRMALTGGTSPVEYLKAFCITLFLTSEEKDVEEALKRGKDIFKVITPD